MGFGKSHCRQCQDNGICSDKFPVGAKLSLEKVGAKLSLEKVGAKLNPKKCKFCKPSVKFLGHVVDRDGIRAHEEKTAAIRGIERPKNVPQLRRFLGMVNQLG